ncbi:hypothetical protein Zm00014a_014908 [Zea mays]|jgi:hypothetical protein|uniref:Uncharacterized protein n=1 Tax=Zea mays TaxID=4577 RepID=A0A3L6DPM6_MAIZE|nr:hypothetical protein Zm00014a_014908 [Zea mays]
MTMGRWWRAFNGSAWIAAAAGGSLVVGGERGELSGVVLHREIVAALAAMAVGGYSGMDDSEEEATAAWARGGEEAPNRRAEGREAADL